MDNFNVSNVPGNANPNKPIPLGEDLDKPIPFDDGTGDAVVSHSPVTLGGGGTAEAPKKEMPKIETPKAPVKRVAQKIVSTNRITGVKTFFTKLHPGALDFLDEQITKWLKDNPGLIIRRTNTVTGDVQAKKTEPNIIITIWY